MFVPEPPVTAPIFKAPLFPPQVAFVGVNAIAVGPAKSETTVV